MATETELERLVIRLIGDNTAYRAALEQAQAQTVETVAKIETAGGRFESIFTGIGNTTAGTLETIKDRAQQVGDTVSSFQAVKTSVDDLNIAFVALTVGLTSAQPAWEKLKATWKDSSASTVDLAKDIATFGSSVGAVAGGTVGLIGKLQSLWTYVKIGSAVVGQLATGFLALVTPIGGLVIAVAAFAAVIHFGPKIYAFFAGISKAVEEVRQKHEALVEQINEETEEIMADWEVWRIGADRLEYYATKVTEVYEEMNNLSPQIEEARKRVEGLDTWWRRWTGNRALRLAQAELEGLRSRADAYRDRLAQLNEAQEKIQKAADEAYGGRRKTVEFELRTVGMSDIAKRMQELREKGVSEQNIGILFNLESQLAAAQAAEKLSKSIENSNKELEIQMATFGMTAAEAWAYKQRLDDVNGANEEAIALGQSMRERLQLMQRGKQITEEFMDPQEKLTKRMKELNELLDAGTISYETYQRAVEAAGKSSQAASSQFQATRFGSVEAMSRIQAYLDTNAPPVIGGRLGGVSIRTGLQQTPNLQEPTAQSIQPDRQDRLVNLSTEMVGYLRIIADRTVSSWETLAL